MPYGNSDFIPNRNQFASICPYSIDKVIVKLIHGQCVQRHIYQNSGEGKAIPKANYHGDKT